ncbi:hypothetical protein [Terriglobus sp. ADX1]|uniref:hypothetical protein n=1 Tax=Terriglobus sp. ADX1 TaxID=2794063 RepID=UPI002FE56C3B
MYHGQTLKAWQPFQDCQASIERLESASKPEIWRVDYVATVTLLRAVGHVLMNVDATTNLLVRAKLQMLWNDIEKHKSLHKIYWDFIKPERDRVLKEYLLSVSDFEEADEAILRFSADGCIKPWAPDDKTLYLEKKAALASGYSLPIDAAGLMSEALAFWLFILTEIELHISPHSETDCPF